jgi:signal transduction histidine kinase
MLILTHLTDNGNGISEETMKQIFDPFFTTKSEGTGLGTSIAFEIMRSHNGRIDYAKGSNGGTICTLEFPLHLEEEPLIHA